MTQEDMRSIIESSNMVAVVVTNYYLELKKLDHSDDNALKLAIEYQKSILSMAAPKNDLE